MKKYVFGCAAMLMGLSLLTACSDNDGAQHGTVPVLVSNGIYMVCSGNSRAGIDGALTYYDYTTKTTTADVFSSSNGIKLGETPNDALRYGNKLYIVVSGEHKVFVTDAKTLRLQHTIDMTALMGEQDGASPRRICASDGKVFVTTYGGYVAAIDTLGFALQKKYKAGSYPEGVAVANGYLYVANSDYGNGNASISTINLTTGTDTPILNENIRNPQDIVTAGHEVYFLDYGRYDEDWNQKDAGVYHIYSNASGTVVEKVIADATMMAAAGTYIYTINAPYGGDDVTYSIYDIQSTASRRLSPQGIESPAAIGIDPVTGDVMIASYRMNGDYADYAANAYVNIYDNAMRAVKESFECGVGPQRFVNNLSIENYTY